MSRFDNVDRAICDLYRFGYIELPEANRRAEENCAESRRFDEIKKLFAAVKAELHKRKKPQP